MKYLRAKDLAKMLGVNQSTIWRWRKKKSFPNPTNLGPNTVVWSQSAIEEWINAIDKES
ncbi:helix-turn-helix transcriptional regulator [Colwellia sp. E150_009]